MPGDRARDVSVLHVRFALIAASAVLLFPLAWPLVTWRVMTSGDLLQFHLPMRSIYQHALKSGDSFLWSSALGSGVYLHAEGQTGMAHPFHLLLYRWLPLTAAFNLEMLSSYVFAAAGMWLLLRRLALGREMACAGGLMFAFSGFTLLHLSHLNAVAVVAHAPWLLWAADLQMTGSSGRERSAGFAFCAATIGSGLLLGFPQAMWLDAVALGWFVVYRSASGPPWRAIALVVAAVACGVLIGAVQWLPTLDALRSSVRADTTPAFRLSYSLHPVNLVQLVSPYALHARIYAPVPDEHFMHEFGVYDGAVATVALCWIALRWPMLRRRREAIGLLALAGVGLVLALGRFGGVYSLVAHLPGISGFRAPTRHIVLVHFALAGLVAIALEDLSGVERRSVSPRRLAVLAIPVLLSVAVAVLVAFGADPQSGDVFGIPVSSAGAALAGTGFIVAASVLFAFGGRGYRIAVPALIVLAAADAFCWGTRYAYATSPAPITHIAPEGGIPAGAKENDLVHPSAMRNDMNLYPMWGLRSSTVYLGLVRASAIDPHRQIAQRIAGVQWTWTSSGWARLAGTMPRVRLLTDYRVTRDEPDEVERIDVARTALLSEPVAIGSGPPGTARLLDDRPGMLDVETRAPSAQLLVLAERFHPGWRVSVDGTADAAPVAVYGDFLGCVVPPGTHRITLTFAPESARVGAWITLAGLVFAAAGAFLVARG